MEVVDRFRKIKSYIQQRWVNITLIGFALLLLIKKDLSVEINMQNPVNKGTPEQAVKPGKGQESSRKKANLKITDLFKSNKKGQAAQAHIGESLNFFSPAFIPDVPSISGENDLVSNKISNKQVSFFIDRFENVARNEMRKHGVPASIILSQALVSSFAGEGELALKANNYFALPCTPEWKGATYKKDGQNFRKYETAWYSFRDNSIYAQSGKYGPVPSNLKGDYTEWAKAFSNSENGEDRNYARLLIDVIEEFGLSKYDK